jgi:hypothetical protein
MAIVNLKRKLVSMERYNADGERTVKTNGGCVQIYVNSELAEERANTTKFSQYGSS